MKEFALAEWDRAKADLATAEEDLARNADAAASRAYYAAFHAVQAVLALRGQSYAKHSGVRAAVHRDLILSGGWPAELGHDYDALMDAREVADYGGTRRIDPEGGRLALKRARRIVDFVRQSCPELAAP